LSFSTDRISHQESHMKVCPHDTVRHILPGHRFPCRWVFHSSVHPWPQVATDVPLKVPASLNHPMHPDAEGTRRHPHQTLHSEGQPLCPLGMTPAGETWEPLPQGFP